MIFVVEVLRFKTEWVELAEQTWSLQFDVVDGLFEMLEVVC
jgi:hypothetical protein